MISRDRIQDTLDEAAERGRLTRSDANDLVSELVRRGREQTDSVLGDIERLLLGRGRSGSSTKLATPGREARARRRTRQAHGVGQACRSSPTTS